MPTTYAWADGPIKQAWQHTDIMQLAKVLSLLRRRDLKCHVEI